MLRQQTINWQKYIGINPEIHFGKPCIITRILGYDVLEWLAQEMSFEDILAGLAYAAQKERKIRYA